MSSDPAQVAAARAPKLPSAHVYEQEYMYWPWGRLLEAVADWVSSNAPQSAFLLDYMCGTAHLLNRISHARPDLTLAGCSLTSAYIDFAQREYPNIDVVLEDALAYRPKQSPEITICTAGLHHLERHKQPTFLEKTASELVPGGYFLLGEELIAEYGSEKTRRLAVVEMCSALLEHAIESDAPHDLLAAASDVLANDLLERGEFKTCQSQIHDMLERHYVVEQVRQTWPSDTTRFGDFLFVCRKN